MPRLLLIEDNTHMQRIYFTKFQMEGFEVSGADTGENGLTFAETTHPDVIVLDIMLPKLDGFTVLERLKENPATRDIPVFVLSNKAWSDDVERALALGARQFYSKGSATLQKMTKQMRQECSLKQLLIAGQSPAGTKELAAILKHPKLLCATCTALADLSAAVERGSPELLIIDARTAAQNTLTALKNLQANKTGHQVPIVVITAERGKFERVQTCIAPDRLGEEFGPTVFSLLGLTTSAATLAA